MRISSLRLAVFCMLAGAGSAQSQEQIHELVADFAPPALANGQNFQADWIDRDRREVRYSADGQIVYLGSPLPDSVLNAPNQIDFTTAYREYLSIPGNDHQLLRDELAALENFRAVHFANTPNLVVNPDPLVYADLVAEIQGGYGNRDDIIVRVLPWGFENPDGGAIVPVIRISIDGNDSYEVPVGGGADVQLQNLAISGGMITNVAGGNVPPPVENCSPENDNDLSASCFYQTVKIIGSNGDGSGVLIHPRYVLTALHVVSSSFDSSLSGINEVQLSNDMKVNIHNLLSVSQIRPVTIEGVEGQIDLAILQLAMPVSDGDGFSHTSPILAAAQFDKLAFSLFSGVGYGLDRNGFGANIRRRGNLRYSDCGDNCNAFIMNLRSVPFEGTDLISSPCKIDSGSPVFVETRNMLGQPELAVTGILMGRDPSTGSGGACAVESVFVNLVNDEIQQALFAEISDMEQSGLSIGDIVLDQPPVPSNGQLFELAARIAE